MNLTAQDLERLFSSDEDKSTDEIICYMYQSGIMTGALDDFDIVNSETLDEMAAEQTEGLNGAMHVQSFLANVDFWENDEYFRIDDNGNAENIKREDLKVWLEEAVAAANSKAMA